jgi:hypothetical protein
VRRHRWWVFLRGFEHLGVLECPCLIDAATPGDYRFLPRVQSVCTSSRFTRVPTPG